ncbi:MAG: glycosyltransferase [Lachnospiraceae bacterium]|jgi:lipopolysaccharide biosynthesis glycosyltransferase|nr:glycosyltransferase [Lachnospiraceae bacterium]
MDVVYASNDKYARHMAVSMYSLMDYNQVEERIRIFVLAVDLSQENQDRLKETAEQFKREIIFIPMGDLRKRFPYAIDTGGFDISAMGRLFVGSVLPDDVKRVLYLDCDTLVVSSLKKLWENDLKGRLLGAVMEPTIYPQVKRSVGLKEEEPYYNSGVLLIDLAAWRKREAEKKLIDFYGKMGGMVFACDQDTLNGAFKGQIKSLSPRYNFFTNYRYFSYEELAKQSVSYRAVPKNTFNKAKKHPAILHFAGDERPWKAGNLGHYRRAYEQYLEMTPWAGTPKEGGGLGQRAYLLAYHMMDYVTLICPPVRRWISRNWGMKAVQGRNLKNGRQKMAECQPNQRKKKVSCVILNYNDAETTIKLVKKICLYQALDAVVVVDNHSTDGSVRKLKAAIEGLGREQVILLEAEKNGGYGAGNNLGIFYSCQVLYADYVLIANPDVEFSERLIWRLKGLLEANPDFGAVSAAMKDPVYGRQKNGWPILGLWGNLARSGPVCRRLFRGLLEYREGYFKGKKVVLADAVHGSLLMVDGQKMVECGGYDEAVFLYHEEEILGRKLKQKGYQTAILLTDYYVHRHSESISKTYQDIWQRQKIRNQSAMYYYKQYLTINPLQELAVRAFFQAVRLEIWFCSKVLKLSW